MSSINHDIENFSSRNGYSESMKKTPQSVRDEEFVRTSFPA